MGSRLLRRHRLALDKEHSHQPALPERVVEHWRTYGRNYYTRHHYEEIDLNAANGLMDALREATKSLPGKSFGPHKVEAADDFAYHGCRERARSGRDAARLRRALRAPVGQARPGDPGRARRPDRAPTLPRGDREANGAQGAKRDYVEARTRRTSRFGFSWVRAVPAEDPRFTASSPRPRPGPPP